MVSQMSTWARKHVLEAYCMLFFMFMLAPLFVVVVSSFGQSAIIQFPPEDYSLRWYDQVLSTETFIEPAINSFFVAIGTTIVTLVIGLPAAYGLVRFRIPGSSMISAFLLSPLIVPQLAIGIALLYYFSSSLQMPPSLLTLLLAHVVIALPYVVRVTISAMSNVNVSLEEGAMNLGAGRIRVLWSIVLPLIRPGVVAGALFAFLASFDNAVVSLFLVSTDNVTLPIAIFTHVEFNFDPSIAAVSAILILLSMLVVGLVIKLGYFQDVRF